MTLSEFLLARIAEDEAAAQAATPGPWRWDHTPVEGWGHQPPDLVTVAEEARTYTLNSGKTRTYILPVGTIISSWGHDADGVDVGDEDAAHIARHDPARVLAECAAKRRIVEACEPIYGADDWEYTDAPELAFTVLRALALPYADHPDFREEWLPRDPAAEKAASEAAQAAAMEQWRAEHPLITDPDGTRRRL